MIRLFTLALFILSFSNQVLSASPCGVTLTGDIKPISSEICAEDMSLGHIYNVFPSITKDAIGFYDLDNKNEILSELNNGRTLSKSSYAIERYIKYSTIIIFNVVKLIWLIQIFLVFAATIKDKRLGGDAYGSSGVILRLAVGVLLFMPYGESGTIGTLILMGGYFLSLAISNIFISTIGYFYQSWTPQLTLNVKATSGDDTYIPPRFVGEYSRALTESMICMQHAELAFIRDEFVESNNPAPSIIANSLEPINGANGITSSLIKVTNSQDVYVRFLPKSSFIENEYFQCAKFGYSSSGISSDVRDYIDGGGESWTEIGDRLADEIKGDKGVSERDAQELALTHMSSFYRAVMLRDLYGDLDNALEIANRVATLSRTKSCLADPLAYVQSRDTISKLNSGENPSMGFDLRCALLTDSKISMLYDTNNQYMNPNEPDYDEGDDALKIELSRQLELLEDSERLLFSKLVNRNAEFAIEHKKRQQEDSKRVVSAESESLIKLRKYGVAGFSMLFLTANEDFEDIIIKRLNQSIYSPSIELSVDADTMLPMGYVKNSRNSETLDGFFPVSPPFSIKSMGLSRTSVGGELRTVDSGDNGISDLFSEVLVGLGGVMSLGEHNSLVSSSFSDIEPDSLSEGILASLQNAMYHLTSFVNADFLTISDGYIKDNESETSAKQRFISECLSGRYDNFSSNDTMVKRCESYQRHPMLSVQELGRSLLIYAGSMFLFQFVLDFVGGTYEYKSAVRKSDALIGKEKPSFSKSMLYAASKSVVSSGIIASIVLILLLFGVFFAFVLPLMPNIIFLMMYLGWFVYAVITFILSPLLFMSFVILKGKDESGSFSEKNLINVAVNFTLKPVLVLVSFVISWLMLTIIYRLTLVLFGYYIDSLSVSLTGSEVYDYFVSLFSYIILIFAFYKIMYWAFTKPPQVINMLMDRIGGENIISKEGSVKNIVGAMGYSAMFSQINVGFGSAAREINKSVVDITSKVNSGSPDSIYKDELKRRGLNPDSINALSSENAGLLINDLNKLRGDVEGLKEREKSIDIETSKLESKVSKSNDIALSYEDKIKDLMSGENVESSDGSISSEIEVLNKKLEGVRESIASDTGKLQSLHNENIEVKAQELEIKDKIDDLTPTSEMMMNNHMNNVISLMFELEPSGRGKLEVIRDTFKKTENDLTSNISKIIKSDYSSHVHSIMAGEGFDVEAIKLKLDNEIYDFEFDSNGLISRVSLK